jgi:hypothetical protein
MSGQEIIKKTGKIALYVVTPTILLLIVLATIWAYKKYKKPKEETKETSDGETKDEKKAGITPPLS